MFRLIKRCFLACLAFLPSVNSLNCFSISNQKCKTRPQIVNVNEDDPEFFPFSIKTSKCSGSCNNINNPLTTLCVPDVVKNLNVKVFNLVSGTNETSHIEWHETFSVNVDSNIVFVLINNIGMMINACANAKN